MKSERHQTMRITVIPDIDFILCNFRHSITLQQIQRSSRLRFTEAHDMDAFYFYTSGSKPPPFRR